MIFEHNSKKRWLITITVLTIFISIAVVLFVLHIWDNQLTPEIHANSFDVLNNSSNQDNITEELTSKAQTDTTDTNADGNFQALQVASNDKLYRAAFIIQNDSKSIEDMKNHIDEIDVIFPDWLTFTGKNDNVVENIDASLFKYLKSSGKSVMPRISNIGSDDKWLGKSFSDYIKTYERQVNLSGLIVNALKKYNLKGINLDFESIDITAKNDYLDFLNILKAELHNNGMVLTVEVPMNDEAYDYEMIGNIADKVVIMAYDEHFTGSESGPIASQEWYVDGVSEVLKRISNEKIIIAVGQYSYDWNITKKTPATSMSFEDAIMLATKYNAQIKTEDQSVNSNFTYKDENGDLHNVWMLDAISLWNQMQVLKDNSVYGIALWRVGLEDSSIWRFYGKKDIWNLSADILSDTDSLPLANFKGTGEMLSVVSPSHNGERDLSINDKLIDFASYSFLPQGYEVNKFGKGDSSNIVLTFDDGPDPLYTAQILDVLKKYNVKATFFAVGDQASTYPDLIKRELNEGHLIGNHTYTHPDITTISESDLKDELNKTQRVFENIIGRETLLFRSPYDTDSTPTINEELWALYTASSLGYSIVNANIDSDDYKTPGVESIVNSVTNGLSKTGSNIILMHDAGGDRSQTVAALDILIPQLQSKGYKFVNSNDLMGVESSSLMPKLTPRDQVIIGFNKLWGKMLSFVWWFIIFLFAISTVISIFRIVFLGYFVLKPKSKFKASVDFHPFVSVVIPAFNEELVIKRTIEELLKSTYNNFEILVVDDGSTDSTKSIAETLANKHPKIRVLTKRNGGKFSALNYGFAQAKADYIVTIDADTIILSDTLQKLIAPFADEKVDAVCGNVRVGNVKNILTGFQAVEYITTQNYDRRAFDALNCISVVPGATGAWKKQKVLEVGGYSGVTLTEDADLTLTMIKSGARIVYANDAVSLTEAPETIKELFKQRFRWSFGTFQCIWKHRKSLFKGSLGLVALPNMIIFQIIFPIISPIGDIVLLLSMFRGDMKALAAGYLLFLTMDFTGSIIAFVSDNAPKKYLFYILIQRFFYRQFMYIVAFRAIFASLKGKRHEWNKLDRTNSIKLDLSKATV